jgi:electron transfer flavoprotein beta subunit
MKRVVDSNVRVRLKADGSGIDVANVKMSTNPFDEIAIEEAVRLKEAGFATEILAVSIGVQQCQETLRTAFSLGADRGIHVKSDLELEPLIVAKILRALCERERPMLAILGKQAIDDDCNQTGQMLAALMNWPQGTFASKLEVNGERLVVTREIDGGVERVKLRLPAVVTADLRLNVPRYATFANTVKSKRMPIEQLTPDQLGVQVVRHVVTLKLEEPRKRQSGRKVGSVHELVDKLQNEAHVI